MGDFADDAVDQALGFDHDYGDYEDGEMDGFVRRPRKKRDTCDYCGKTGLMWRSTRKGWKLVYQDNPNKQHKCPEYRAAMAKGKKRHEPEPNTPEPFDDDIPF